MGGIELSSGYVDAQYASDYMTLKARKRLAFLIRLTDRNAFRHVAAIDTALTTLSA
jgi:hypothetical protein